MRRAALAVVLACWSPPSIQAQQPSWTVDASVLSFVEAWDLNRGAEFLNGIAAALDRVVWRDVAIRAEGFVLFVDQAGGDTWVRGATLAMRVRRRLWGGASEPPSLFLDVGGGASTASRPVPPRGTQFNYVLQIGGGVELPLGGAHLTVAARWLHLSNNSREGSGRNPDIQSVGAVIGVGTRF